MKKNLVIFSIAAVALFLSAKGTFHFANAAADATTTTATTTATSTATSTVAVATTTATSTTTSTIATATTTATTPVINCPPTAADMAQIQAAGKNVAKQLAARQALLAQVITCAKTNADALQLTLTTSAIPSSAAGTQSALSGKIDDAIDYYNNELSDVGAAGIGGTEAIASNVLQWKTANYDPLAGQVSNLILWSQNQDLFTTAQDRMNQMGSAVSFLQSAAQNDDLQADFSAAQADFTTAQTENQAAESALAELLPPEQSLMPIQQSLQDLATTYKDFSKTDALIQTLLPTGN